MAWPIHLADMAGNGSGRTGPASHKISTKSGPIDDDLADGATNLRMDPALASIEAKETSP